MKVIICVLMINVTLLQACVDKTPTVQIQNYDGPIFLCTTQKPACDTPLLHNQIKTCDSDCTCVTKVPNCCDPSKYNYNVYGNYPNCYETRMCDVPYDVPKICDITHCDVPKVCKQPNYYEVPRVCTVPNYCSDSKFDYSKYYDQYYQQQKGILNYECSPLLGILTEAKDKMGVYPDSFNSIDDSRTMYGYKCFDGDTRYSYGSQGYGTNCFCKKCGGYINL
ncbi:hypothetical protein K1T71_013279 [Dendrolimus kikuchii]|uniref:Uncharacterized protein n=1 Tax=Dendrolimus kikuchii TaxID=765133 RepID=A0ACC1CHK9_9NEOP|nr:hypothetical protein K1T71_013279 [Dendrolimus kikuchii]